MPFKSKAQRRKFAQLLVEGKITPEVYEEWNRETGRSELPERVKPARKTARKATTDRKARKTKRPTTRSRTRPKAKRKTSRR